MSLDAAPDAAPTAAEPVVPAAALPRLSARQGSDAWEIEKRQMALLLREAAPDAAWAVRLEAALARQRLLTCLLVECVQHKVGHDDEIGRGG